MADLSVQLKGQNRIVRSLRKLSGETEKQTIQTTRRALQKIRTTAVRDVAVDKGRLRQSIRTREFAGGLAGKVVTNVVYASAVEFGTKPHVIVPRRAKALRWIGQAGSRVTDRKALFVSARTGRLTTSKANARAQFAKRVNHPGTKAQPYMRPAYKQWKTWYLANIPRGVKVAIGTVTR